MRPPGSPEALERRRAKAIALPKESSACVVELLPAYAPEINPGDQLWSYLKHDPSANDAPFDSSAAGTCFGP